jgi:hypothetical protein
VEWRVDVEWRGSFVFLSSRSLVSLLFSLVQTAKGNEGKGGDEREGQKAEVNDEGEV